MGDTHVGLQARLMSQALRKLAGTINRSDTTAIFINQLREKIGVMFGCFQYGTRVTLADGTREKIGKIVNQRMDVEVLAVDPETGDAGPRRVVGWYDNGNAERFLQFTVYKPEGNGRAQFAATEQHSIATPGGWRSAGELEVGDRVLMPLAHYLSPRQRQLVLGSLMGNGSISPKRPNRTGFSIKSQGFRFGHGPKQNEYALWKASLLQGVPTCVSRHAKGGWMIEPRHWSNSTSCATRSTSPVTRCSVGTTSRSSPRSPLPSGTSTTAPSPNTASTDRRVDPTSWSRRWSRPVGSGWSTCCATPGV